MTRFLRVWLGSGLAVLAGACAGHEVENPTAYEIYLSAPPAEPPKYVLQPGDQLEVRFAYMPERNVILPVRPDGYISIPLANEVLAAGRTPEELRVALTEACARELKSPELSVVVKSFSAYKVHVGGHVAKGGIFELTGARNVLQAVFEAGGFLPTASLENVLVIRRNGPTTYAVIPIDLQAVLEGRSTQQNIELRPYDAIYVPATPIADVNKWVDQYIRQNLPFDLGWEIQF